MDTRQMASSDYTHGTMDISEQSRTWKGFMSASLWGSAILLLIIGYAVFTLAIGMNWLIALAIVAGAGLVGGVLMGMGGAWIGTIIGLTALAVIIQIIISLASALL